MSFKIVMTARSVARRPSLAVHVVQRVQQGEGGAIHPKAMPVILRTGQEIETWLTAPEADALKLARPLPDGVLKIVRRGGKEDMLA